jgi:hypothetical protein
MRVYELVPSRRRLVFWDENRAYLVFHGVPFVVWEPWGDNSRYWIGPAVTKAAPDLGPVTQDFRDC